MLEYLAARAVSTSVFAMEETVTMRPDLLGTIILAASTVHR